MYAIIETGSKQYKVKVDDQIMVEKLNLIEGETIEFDKVLLIANEGHLHFGKPYLSNAKIVGKVLKQAKHEKIIVFHKKRRKGYMKKNGHKQPYTLVEVTDILLN